MYTLIFSIFASGYGYFTIDTFTIDFADKVKCEDSMRVLTESYSKELRQATILAYCIGPTR